jgi:hypothetical protein
MIKFHTSFLKQEKAYPNYASSISDFTFQQALAEISTSEVWIIDLCDNNFLIFVLISLFMHPPTFFQ